MSSIELSILLLKLFKLPYISSQTIFDNYSGFIRPRYHFDNNCMIRQLAILFWKTPFFDSNETCVRLDSSSYVHPVEVKREKPQSVLPQSELD